ncbi:prepilin peptidase [Agrococcus jejuensis]|uniref:Leader peptidase (Prepilin peptidase) / N-methyltransferase n=1 Tax=Agrococcus jejuensis TaxID=399736 RepID=A0A1G8B5F6_9MICO|nr:prepilin peptidase [Agrococcus jejuensis]SDH28492.1 leader peptidase (prepilin peptidase) / N-methyltransferase [Agrococcus jejuensis]
MLADLRAPAVPLRLRAIDGALGIVLAAGAALLSVQAGWMGAAGAATTALVVAALVAPALARIDLADRRLPNALTVPLLGVALACAVVGAVLGAWVGGVVALGVVLVLGLMWWFGGMGAGDLKLGAGLALAAAPLEWWLPLGGIACAFVLGGAVGVVAKVRGAESVPFGPWLLAGAGVAVVLAAV